MLDIILGPWFTEKKTTLKKSVSSGEIMGGRHITLEM